MDKKNKKELRKEYKKVGINNKLRRLINDKIATLTIYSEDKQTRLNATKNIIKNLENQDETMTYQLKRRWRT